MDRDPYEILGVARDAPDDEIKSVYRRLARETHPDVNPGDEAAEERFKEISWAKEVLLDNEKRQRFDEFGDEGLAAGFDPEKARAYQQWARRAGRSPGHDQFGGDVDVEDLLSQLFQGRGGGAQGFEGMRGFGRQGPLRGSDLEAEVGVDFLDVVRSAEVELKPEGRPKLKVSIPPGARDGTRIRLAGQGAPAPGEGPPGDLFIRLRVRPHAFFKREGDDLRIDVPVTIPELVLGAEIDVPTPDGPVRMTVPSGSQAGRRLRLREKGARRRDGGRGDLYVRLDAVLPEHADAEKLEAAVRELEALYPDDVRAHLREGL
ncbi:MAG: J domain-containing protein [Deltaproteobacteria bacterium]|nr:J domain-containing protein [Deltaproteobacteria bacterium]